MAALLDRDELQSALEAPTWRWPAWWWKSNDQGTAMTGPAMHAAAVALAYNAGGGAVVAKGAAWCARSSSAAERCLCQIAELVTC